MRTLCLFLSILCLSPGMAFSAERAKVVVSMTRPLTTGCVLNAARASGMPPAALFGLLATEGGSMGEALRACLETHLSIMKRFNSMLAMAI